MSDDNSQKSNSRGLGRGLSALIGNSEVLTERASQDVSRETPIDLIKPNPNQPRRSFDNDELKALSDTIKEHGVVQPIVIRPMGDGSGNYSIIAGERRWRASQLAGLHSIPAVVRDFDDLVTLKVAIVENLQRQNLNAIEEAHSYGQLMDRFGYNQQSIADTVGKSRAYIANTLRLLGLPREVQEMVVSGILSAGHARAALMAQDPLAAANEMASKGMSVREAEKQFSSTLEKKQKAAPKEVIVNSDVSALSNDLTQLLGLNVKIKFSEKKGGFVQISYHDLEQLNDLCRRLSHSSI